MSLPTPLAVLLIVAGLWSLGAWSFVAFRALRAARTAPGADTVSGAATGAPDASGSTGTRTPTETPTTTPALPLLVVAISITLALATLVVGFRALG
ncbi:hypothetical protein [Tersicoccus sp. Bi-70]|uniref:hypothetical protein n=1 Tax=Tersicoccus sp. Bi-70 TaxID=1897634 RepID=UPI0009768238|nr:hypothetical protein [Tersicoccus sp. Bi-70]OMH31352.1 hypothetical protein BGP79_10060 [Tersicoccus sp. Bi-70]